MIRSGRVDIVSICTPPAFHKDLAIAALNAGLTVLCEKPLAHTLEDAEAIAPWLSDWRGRVRGEAVAILAPASTAEVAAVVEAERELAASSSSVGPTRFGATAPRPHHGTT